MIRITLPGAPITKKNSQQIVYAGARPMIVPSAQYKAYRGTCLKLIPSSALARIDYPINLKAVYYMPTKRRVDLCNLLEATCDILVDAGVLMDDCSTIVAAHDGSRVDYDKEQPRVEIEIRPIIEGEKVEGVLPI